MEALPERSARAMARSHTRSRVAAAAQTRCDAHRDGAMPLPDERKPQKDRPVPPDDAPAPVLDTAFRRH